MNEELTISEMVAVKAVAQKPIAFCYLAFDNNITTNQDKFRKHNAQQVKNKIISTMAPNIVLLIKVQGG